MNYPATLEIQLGREVPGVQRDLGLFSGLLGFCSCILLIISYTEASLFILEHRYFVMMVSQLVMDELWVS